MKKIILSLLMLIPTIGFSQEATLNLETKKYEYVEVVEESRDATTTQKRLTELNYKNIQTTANSIKAESLISEMVLSFVNEISYEVKIDIKEGKYRITITNIKVKQKTGTEALEDMGGFTKKWLKKFNEKLPEIITKLKSKSSSKDW